MNTFLDKILAAKRAALARRPPQAASGAKRPAASRTLQANLRPGAVIAEVKRASPSQGAIDLALDPAALARRYAAAGAAAISCLTEEDFFHGSLADLAAVRAAVTLPVLRKDFVIDRRQIDETAGRADALLLIVRLLDAPTLAAFAARCRGLGIEPVVEVYDEADLATLAAARIPGPLVVGINNRDLATFRVDLANAGRLAAKLPPGSVPVAFSGVSSAADARRLRAAGLSRALVGTALVRRPAILPEITSALSPPATTHSPVLRFLRWSWSGESS